MGQTNTIIRERLLKQFPEVNPKTLSQIIAMVDVSLQELRQPAVSDQVSVDISTGEHDADRRIFATIEGKQQDVVNAPNERVWLARMEEDTFTNSEQELREIFERRFPVPEGIFFDGHDYDTHQAMNEPTETAFEYNGKWLGFKAAYGLE